MNKTLAHHLSVHYFCYVLHNNGTLTQQLFQYAISGIYFPRYRAIAICTPVTHFLFMKCLSLIVKRGAQKCVAFLWLDWLGNGCP